MARAEISLLPRMRPHPRLRARMTALVLMVVFGLIAAPAWSALRNECDLCPPTCPMHHHGDAAATAVPHLHCHGVQNAPHEHASALPRVDRPPCGNHGVAPDMILPPVILAAVLGQRIIPADNAAPPFHAHAWSRLAEPPDTPPPITRV